MEELPDIPIMILAGGEARRFGRPKGLALLNGVPVVTIVRQRLARQTSGPVLLNTDPDGPYANCGMSCIPDTHQTKIGPLAGLYTALDWAGRNGYTNILTAPVDLPFLPLNLLTKLQTAKGPAIASSNGRAHPVCGLWQVDLQDKLATFIAHENRAARAWAEHCGANLVQFANNDDMRDPFFNINTPADLEDAKRLSQ